MKTIRYIQLAILFFAFQGISAQDFEKPQMFTAHNMGKIFISWGGNRESFTKSNVNFRGDGYNFTIEDMQSHDKGKGFHIDYINPKRMTIPQTDFRLGYFVADNWSVSVGWDHMKYVMTQYQSANITGYISGHDQFDGVYNQTPVVMKPEFLTYEHTDGLNYVNAEVARHDDISSIFGINNTDKLQINLVEGFGAGVLYPKTNTMLMGQQRHDEFHISGYGTSVKAALNLTFLKYFYVKGELKAGYINMPDVRTTYDGNDRASQHFLFLQRILAVGGVFRLW